MEKLLKLLKLSELAIGESATIMTIEGRGPLNRRIRDMGVIPGVLVVVEGKAPLGDPIQIKVKGCSLALRKSEAEKIIVKMAEA